VSSDQESPSRTPPQKDARSTHHGGGALQRSALPLLLLLLLLLLFLPQHTDSLVVQAILELFNLLLGEPEELATCWWTRDIKIEIAKYVLPSLSLWLSLPPFFF